jgi:hypothetical protein
VYSSTSAPKRAPKISAPWTYQDTKRLARFSVPSAGESPAK